ncbi:MAG: hypothetical protein IJ802_06790 [Kiritimatiellae bacterium]|nr:hypothetical protein [Kiritimatiellia bacterium]
MKITAIDICAVLAALAASCAARDFSPEAYRHLPDWENPYITSSNRLPARAAFVPAHDEATARKIAFLQEPRNASQWVESLDGEWDFHWRAVPEPFDTDIPAKDAKITVPSCWQLQGEYDVPIYTNSRYPHVRNPPRIMEPDPPEDFTAYRMRNPVGTYRRTFSIPNAWQGRRITLRFDGVYSAFYVRINGVTAG